jgi:steroid delta-isomerase
VPTHQQIEHAINNHFEAWNGRDSERWFANFTDDVMLEDPVGGPRKVGRAGLEKSWEKSFQRGHSWTLQQMLLQICQDQAALHVKSHGQINGQPVEVDSIEIYTINDAGKVSHVRTYFNPPAGQTLDPYFMQVEQ